MSDIEYSFITSDVIKSFDCKILTKIYSSFTKKNDVHLNLLHPEWSKPNVALASLSTSGF